MNRRDLISTSGTTNFGLPPVKAGPTLIKPPRVRPGDRVGLVSPATAAYETEATTVWIHALEALGLEVMLGSNYFSQHEHFAGAVDARADDINAFFREPSIKMIFARGGWGSPQLLPLLDYELMRQNPKVLLGYSDATALITAVHVKTGLVTFRGPPPVDVIAAENFQRVIMNGESYLISNPATTSSNVQTIADCKVRGKLLGGKLSLLAALMSAEYLPDCRDSALSTDDVDERFTIPLGTEVEVDAEAGTVELLEAAVC